MLNVIALVNFQNFFHINTSELHTATNLSLLFKMIFKEVLNSSLLTL